MASEDFSEVSDYNQAVKLLETRLPRSSMIYNVVQLKLEQQASPNNSLSIKLLAHNGDLCTERSFLMALINVKGLPQNLIVLSPPEFPTVEMLKSLINSINWGQPNQFEGIENSVVQSIIAHGTIFGKIVDHDPIELYYIPKEKNLQLPEHSDKVIVKQLSLNEASKVNSRWPAICEGSLEMLTASIDFVGSAGVYLKNDSADDKLELVSWAVALPFGSIHALHTEPTHQRKGYAQLTMTAVSQFCAKQNRIPIVQIYKSNDTSKSVNEKVGYIYSHDINLVHFYP